MNRYFVTVQDKSSKKSIMEIPCAEREIADLVCKNLSALFSSEQLIDIRQKSAPPLAQSDRLQSAKIIPLAPKVVKLDTKREDRKHRDRDERETELERELFEDIA